MYTIYHFFAYLVHARGRVRFVPDLVEYPFPSEPLSYQCTTGFPSLVLRMNPGGDPPGGELIGLMDSKSYSVPTFRAHIPAGVMSVDVLRQRKASEMSSVLEAAGIDANALPNREVYYLLRGNRHCYTKLCLVHGSFFQAGKAERVLRLALGQAMSECLDEGEPPPASEVMDLLSRVLAQEVISRQFRSVERASVAFRLEVDTDVIKKGNILDPAYFPAIRDDTISIIIPYSTGESFRVRRRHLKRALTEDEWAAGRKMVITHPFNGKFFVLSYAL